MSAKKLRVLLAEGSPSGTAQTLREIFPEPENALELTVVSTAATLLSTIKIADPEVILLDLSLNLREPYDACRLVRRTAPGVPVIVIADPTDKQHAAQSLIEGAVDYLLKGFIDPRNLDRALRVALEHNTFEGLADLLRDPLTGLYTRDGFLTMGARCQQEAQRTGGELVLLCALIENLGTLRAELGPRDAESALRDVAKILAKCCRRTDLVARIGEAQFAMLAIDAIAPTASVLRQRVEKHLEIDNQARSPGGSILLGMSAGTWAADDNRSFPELLDSVETDLRRTPAAPVALAAQSRDSAVSGESL
ncbi:MAG TPA: diguanylate cyclase [Candidatus Acidoferrum sp.]|jgi:diguanylate cyclase (GGDEF)-like protein|nr:diguanylate cyclase [Candidatus Acidoferrum sp.]